MQTRISLDDSELLPVQAFFNAVSDGSFERVVDCLTKGVGYSINDADCTFPGDLDPGDEPFDGVRFTLFEEQVVISALQLRRYIEFVCADYVNRHPEAEAALTQFLGR